MQNDSSNKKQIKNSFIYFFTVNIDTMTHMRVKKEVKEIKNTEIPSIPKCKFSPMVFISSYFSTNWKESKLLSNMANKYIVDMKVSVQHNIVAYIECTSLVLDLSPLPTKKTIYKALIKGKKILIDKIGNCNINYRLRMKMR